MGATDSKVETPSEEVLMMETRTPDVAMKTIPTATERVSPASAPMVAS